MAIYHFSAKVISRASGSSALAAAAYRSASRLHDERLDRHHDFSNKAGVVHSDVMLPDGAPEHLADREKLWNAVEATEKRIDAQLAREIEFAIPREMTEEQGIALARDFAREEFVDRGMIADLNVHWDIGGDGMPKPHAHVMLTMREVGEDGFGAKNRDWNRTDLLEKWRERWSEHVNQRLAELDIDARIDHRSLEAQGIDLEPQHKIGPAASRMAAQGLASERLEEHHAIARANGERIIADPNIALDAITRQQATFTRRDLAMFVHRHSDGKEQFDRVMGAVRAAPELVALGKDGRGEERFTSRDMIETERRLERAADRLAERAGHGLPAAMKGGIIAAAGSGSLRLGEEQQAALAHITRPRDLAIVTGYAGTGKSAMLGIARDEWERAGYRVVGAALSGIAAENLESGSGIASRTIASLEHQWSSGRELLNERSVLVIDEAGMIGTRQMERVISEAEKRGAKVVLVGDPEQLQAIEAGAAFRALAERHGSVEITQVRRQRDDWQRDATRHLATGRTAEAIAAYDDRGQVHAADTREQARGDLIDRWDRDRAASPGATRIILTHTNDEVGALNIAARERLRLRRALRDDVAIRVERGERNFARGDRIMFLRNECSLGVKNGTLGEVRSATATRLAVLLDDGRSVAFDVKDYAAIDHGYAATVHKAQGMTVDRVHVLATPGLDRHAAYVALSRHRESVDLHYGCDDFADRGRLIATLSRERGKDMASDYLDHRPPAPLKPRDLPRSTLARTDHEERNIPALSDAVARHGKIVRAMRFARSVGDPYSAEQRSELAASRTALNSIVQHGATDLEAAFSADKRLIGEAAAGRTQSVIRAMQLETEMRGDPNLRADVFVQRWQALDRQRRLLMRDREMGRAAKIADSMVGMAKSLERDPQVESILRNRRQALGLPSAIKQGVGRELADMMARTRSRGLDIGI
ncbi:Ti-type conjugative transfer relaxase TraA [Sphingomonas mali]|uniref:Ti-type conjugative transfer relaxase TraA n=1 Tax=Sphingomonas mali TaxID=40682 RepID=UPI0008356E2F|nr:Ti-type conjugative transfer relaxase TraA [Sphingomonas mali]